MRARIAWLVLGLALGACEVEPSADWPLPAGSCSQGERLCYWDGVLERDLVLLCNDGSVDGAIWVIDAICAGDEICQQEACHATP